MMKLVTAVSIISFAAVIAVHQDPECPPVTYIGPSVFVPDYNDCRWYYECAEGVKVHMQCPKDLYWDIKRNTCDHDYEVTCGGAYPWSSTFSPYSPPSERPTPPSPPTASPTVPTPPTAAPTTKPTASTTKPSPPTPPTAAPTRPTPPTAPTTPKPTPPGPGKRCIGVIDGEYRPYPEDCSKYIECVGQKEYYFHCPRDTYYDRSTAKCSSSSADRC